MNDLPSLAVADMKIRLSGPDNWFQEPNSEQCGIVPWHDEDVSPSARRVGPHTRSHVPAPAQLSAQPLVERSPHDPLPTN